jgi:ElaB/YqjD/DUF883 family membrane-anchored ribosome-binding protein
MTSNKKIELASTNDSPADLALLQKDLGKLQADVMTIMKHVKQEGLNETRYLKNLAVDQISGQIDDLQDLSQRSLKKLEKNVKARPAQTVAMAFAVGALASFLLGRR